MQIGLILSSAMDQFLNAEGTEKLLEDVWEKAQDWLELTNRINSCWKIAKSAGTQRKSRKH